MMFEYLKSYKPDGEIIFLAANPNIILKGIGSRLLSELESRENGKLVYCLLTMPVHINSIDIEDLSLLVNKILF